MKTFNELTSEQQVLARKHFLNRDLSAVAEGFTAWLPEELRPKVLEAQRKAEQLRTPWFFTAILYEIAKDEFDELALIAAKDARYAERTDATVVRGIA